MAKYKKSIKIENLCMIPFESYIKNTQRELQLTRVRYHRSEKKKKKKNNQASSKLQIIISRA